MRKFYRKGDTTLLKIQGFQYLGTDVYVRNFNLYSEYIFNKINNPNYFNLHTIPDITTYPQLIFSVPFFNITVNSNLYQIKYDIYDFSDQLSEGDLQKHSIEQIAPLIRVKLVPKKNFYRLNFLAFDNKEYSSTDIDPSKVRNIECLGTENKKY